MNTQHLTAHGVGLDELSQTFSQQHEKFLQTEKLASIGQLAAGVAHEINNPIGYIHSNFGSLEKYLGGLFEMLAEYEQAEQHLSPGPVRQRLLEVRQRIELDYLKEDIPQLMREAKEGLVRVRKIVNDLKDFSRTDGEQDWIWADIHQGIDSTLNIVHNEIKYSADVVKNYGIVPLVKCLPSQLNQVFMNLLVNASHAIGPARGVITITTGREEDSVWVEVKDTGSGIARENLSRIFDPFFTTKPIGKGTGLGLSLSYGIITKHGGRIDVDSEVGVGTSFRVSLPIESAESH